MKSKTLSQKQHPEWFITLKRGILSSLLKDKRITEEEFNECMREIEQATPKNRMEKK